MTIIIIIPTIRDQLWMVTMMTVVETERELLAVDAEHPDATDVCTRGCFVLHHPRREDPRRSVLLLLTVVAFAGA